jgi:hypothetical protein
MFLFGREFDPQREEPGTILSTLILINKMIDHVEDHVSSIRVQEIGLDLQHKRKKWKEWIDAQKATNLYFCSTK